MKLKSKASKPIHTEPLHVRLRPATFERVVGQDSAVASLKRCVAKGDTHSFLFTGPSGVGKTTLARIVATQIGAGTLDLVEVDGATKTGIDAMRELMDFATTRPWDGSKRVIVVDECHMLSKQSWNSLLKTVEEPPDHLFWVFCTTDAGKVPTTINTRCFKLDLKPVKWDVLADYLEKIAKAENIRLANGMPELAAKKASGSVRQALVYLSMLENVANKETALALMETAEERKDVIDLIRLLAFGKPSWAEAIKLVKNIKEQEIEPESVRIVTVNYLAACILNAKSENEAKRMLNMMQYFSVPYHTNEKYGPLLLSIGSTIF